MSREPAPTEAAPEASPVPAEGRPARVIAVLGMHRSGTSALAGSLQGYGLFLGAYNTVNKYNVRGNRENRAVVGLNEDILRRNSGSWREPPAVVKWSADHLERGREILAEYAGRPLWGFKDPRTLLTVDGWLRLVPDLEFVGIFRHPARVARSLASRPNLPVQDPVGVWRAYNERLLDLHRRRPFPLLSFDDDSARLERSFGRAAGMLQLAPQPDERFFTEELRRLEAEEVELPAAVRSLYDELRALAL